MKIRSQWIGKESPLVTAEWHKGIDFSLRCYRIFSFHSVSFLLLIWAIFFFTLSMKIGIRYWIHHSYITSTFTASPEASYAYTVPVCTGPQALGFVKDAWMKTSSFCKKDTKEPWTNNSLIKAGLVLVFRTTNDADYHQMSYLSFAFRRSHWGDLQDDWKEIQIEAWRVTFI